MPAGCILWAQQSVSAGYGLPLACAAVAYYSQYQSAATSEVVKRRCPGL